MKDPTVEHTRAQYDAMKGISDSAIADMRAHYAKLIADIDARMAGADPLYRAHLQYLKQRAEGSIAEFERVMNNELQKATRGFDPETGTLPGVKEDAEAMLADLIEK